MPTGCPGAGQRQSARVLTSAEGIGVDAFESQIRELLRGAPRMPATVIAERIGWEQGLTVLKDRVRPLRPYYLPPDPAQPSTAHVFATPSMSVVSA